VRKIILVAICCSVLSSVLTVVAQRYRFDVVSPAYAASDKELAKCFVDHMEDVHISAAAGWLVQYCQTR